MTLHEVCKDFIITKRGEIFRPSGKFDIESCQDVNGQGIFLNTDHSITEGTLSYGIPNSGKINKLFSNGEYYSGNILYKGIKHGTGVY